MINATQIFKHKTCHSDRNDVKMGAIFSKMNKVHASVMNVRTYHDKFISDATEDGVSENLIGAYDISIRTNARVTHIVNITIMRSRTRILFIF